MLEERYTKFIADLHDIYARSPYQWNRDFTAKFCTEFMNKLYIDMIKCKYRLTKEYTRWRSGQTRRDSIQVAQLIIAGGEDEVAEFLWTHLERARFVEVPFFLIIGILLIYISVASHVISVIEGWPLSDGLYFMMISVLTVGFGDLVPRNETFILVVLFLILAGLVLTTTCVDIVGAYYIDRLHFFGRRVDDDPLSWLKEVQQRRIEAMKREAMRKLLETVTALHHIRLTALKRLVETPADIVHELPAPPRNLIASHATADSMLLRWSAPPYVDEGKRYWYTLTYKPRTPQRRSHVVRVDFINEEKYLVTGLKSFTLYEFSLATTTRFGSGKCVKAQEYTEPCTVPQSLHLEAVSCETATVSWRSPKVNNGSKEENGTAGSNRDYSEQRRCDRIAKAYMIPKISINMVDNVSYVILFIQEPAPQFIYWNRYKVGTSTRFTLTDLMPDTRYILCVLAEHNHGLTAMSRSLRFRTRRWWTDDDSNACLQLPYTNRKTSMSSVVSSLSALRMNCSPMKQIVHYSGNLAIIYPV
ncbi:hypothetical protein KIN20_000264 [Parelaphostrongylus tenuis]|uniref:Fibronectin type-III domain-containing protein n=1 Tax=Parelaphostrongylus tenuis TaxID=148309 RepID=A0AAD5LS78_PARTN|nr:hypothetical protein KIN20_000264 [Parelaphostrongylus tenuis]